MTDPCNIQHDKRVQHDKKHQGNEPEVHTEHVPQPGKKPHVVDSANDSLDIKPE